MKREERRGEEKTGKNREERMEKNIRGSQDRTRKEKRRGDEGRVATN